MLVIDARGVCSIAGSGPITVPPKPKSQIPPDESDLPNQQTKTTPPQHTQGGLENVVSLFLLLAERFALVPATDLPPPLKVIETPGQVRTCADACGIPMMVCMRSIGSY